MTDLVLRSELSRARAHLLNRQADLAEARIWKATHSPRLGMTGYENNFLAALSWVWEEQEKAEIAETAAIIEKYCLPIPALDPTMIDWQAFFGMRA